MWASGARSPEAPTEPLDGIQGRTSAFTSAMRASSVRAGRLRRPRQAGDLQHHQQAGDIVGQQGADAAGVAEDEVLLQGLKIFRRDRGVGQQAEAGVDAIDGAALGEDGGDDGRALLDVGPGTGG
jgi:hypothetical protein